MALQAYTPELRARFDLVSFDPRGVGSSTPVRCFDTIEEQQQALVASVSFRPVTTEQQAQRGEADAALAASCGQRAGQLPDHVSTADVARDLDVLRAAVGDPRLTRRQQRAPGSKCRGPFWISDVREGYRKSRPKS